jgi:hypothetical protein
MTKKRREVLHKKVDDILNLSREQESIFGMVIDSQHERLFNRRAWDRRMAKSSGMSLRDWKGSGGRAPQEDPSLKDVK